MDIDPKNNRDTFQGRGILIKELEEQVEQLKQKLIYKDRRFDKLWDLCCDTEFTVVALRLFEEWENE